MNRAKDRKGRCLPRRGGFTLLELLVVIAIISLLISILLPSLDAARRASKNSACLSHIKNIATSSRVYEADDPSGWGIPIHPLQFLQASENPTWIGAYEWGGKSGIGRPEFTSDFGIPNGGSKYGTAAGFGPSSRPLNDILYPGGFREGKLPDGTVLRIVAQNDQKLELELYRCPGDDGPPRGAHCPDWVKNTEQSSYDHFGNSYAANVFMVGQVGGGCVLSNSPYMRSTSRVPTPARTLYYEENIGRWAWSCKSEQDVCIQALQLQGVDPGPTKQLRGWHGRDWTYNRAFVDAHAETQRIYFDGTENEEGYAKHYTAESLTSNPPWLRGCTNVPAERPTPEEREQSYQCITVRGSGWQKDTLPAPFVQTGLMWDGNGRPSYEDCVESD